MSLPEVDPLPPRLGGAVPWVGAGAALLRDPSGFFVRARTRLGDTFVVDAFGRRLFCVFSPAGVRRLYEVPESQASKGLADFALLRLKLPDELMLGRRTRPHDLFGSEEVEGYLSAVEHTVGLQLAEMGDEGTFDAFTLGRRLGQRIGLAVWAGAEAAAPPYLDRLLGDLDRLEASDAFVRPGQAFTTWATRKRREWAAVRGFEEVIGEILGARARSAVAHDDFLARIAAAWSDQSGAAYVSGVARDVAVLHMGAQSNLPAALAWTLTDLLRHPELLERVRGGDEALLERCASESIRMAQRSITMRAVCKPVEVDDGERTYRLAPGVLLTTMLSATNTTAAPGLERYDPDHYEGRRLVPPPGLATRELVSTFGHGRHACPAQRFSISAIRIAVRALVSTYGLDLREPPAPRRRQIGGVARSEAPCRVDYARRVGAGASAASASAASAGNTRATLASK